MGLEELFKRATIEFPKPLLASGVRDLFYYFVAKSSGCEVRPDVRKRSIIRKNPETEKIVEEEFLDSPKVSADVSISLYPSLNRVTAINHPIGENYISEENPRAFYGLKFDTGIYQSVEEVPEHDLMLMDEVRQKTQEFFESRNHSQE